MWNRDRCRIHEERPKNKFNILTRRRIKNLSQKVEVAASLISQWAIFNEMSALTVHLFIFYLLCKISETGQKGKWTEMTVSRREKERPFWQAVKNSMIHIFLWTKKWIILPYYQLEYSAVLMLCNIQFSHYLHKVNKDSIIYLNKLLNWKKVLK